VKIKVDENLPTDLAEHLQVSGHDARTVVEQGLAGTEDPRLARVVAAEGRLLVTLDRGFGDLRHYPPGSHAASSSFALRARTSPPSSSSSSAS
jgi:predicted nuclease of predicted toxin-antitoxin system